MRTTIQTEKLRHLFQAFRDGNEPGFTRVAEGIISEELAANHYSAATDLQRALGKGKEEMDNGAKVAQLTALPPKDRRNGEDLLWFVDVQTPPVVFMAAGTEKQLARVLEEHRRQQVLQKHGYSPKTKLLFWGPPGCGKTLTARYLASELGLPLAVVRLDAIISSFLGDTASHLQKVFARANSTPMVLLLDEADALAKQRDDPNDVGELKRVVNSFLQGMDGFTSRRSILIAASNHQYLFDPALWRRFDDVIEFGPPDLPKREAFIKYLLNGVRFEGGLKDAAAKMAALSYADIEHIVVEAVKTMLLAEGETLQTQALLAELRSWKASVQRARKRVGVASK
jgi:SpoVK/Ycf46/Vps4 family AAA+-type ATPase